MNKDKKPINPTRLLRIFLNVVFAGLLLLLIAFPPSAGKKSSTTAEGDSQEAKVASKSPLKKDETLSTIVMHPAMQNYGNEQDSPLTKKMKENPYTEIQEFWSKVEILEKKPLDTGSGVEISRPGDKSLTVKLKLSNFDTLSINVEKKKEVYLVWSSRIFDYGRLTGHGNNQQARGAGLSIEKTTIKGSFKSNTSIEEEVLIHDTDEAFTRFLFECRKFEAFYDYYLYR